MILVDILEEHLEEAAFLWQQRGAALESRDYDFADLAELDERFLAHLDGLAVGGRESWKLLQPKLAEGEAGEAVAAGLVALQSGKREWIDQVLQAFPAAEGEVLAGLADAFRHAAYVDAGRFLESQLGSESAAVRAAATDALGFRRAPLAPGRVNALLGDGDARVVAAAVRAVGLLRLTEFAGRVEKLQGAEAEPSVRAEAWAAGLLLGGGRALARCREAVASRAEQAARAIALIGLAGRPEDAALLIDVLHDADLARAAIGALGFLGDANAADALIRCAADPALARAAGEALSRITGVRLKDAGLVAEAADPGGKEPEADTGEDEEYVEDPDEGLPMPDAGRLEAWWDENAARYDTKVRWRWGRPHGPDVLLEILRRGSLPERSCAAFELALADPALPVLESSALCARQERELAGLPGPPEAG